MRHPRSWVLSGLLLTVRACDWTMVPFATTDIHRTEVSDYGTTQKNWGLTVYYHGTVKGSGTVIHVHGGSWHVHSRLALNQGGDGSIGWSMALARYGLFVLNLDYQQELFNHTAETEVQHIQIAAANVLAAVRWVRSATTQGAFPTLNGNKIVISGDSNGGKVAAGYALSSTIQGAAGVTAQDKAQGVVIVSSYLRSESFCGRFDESTPVNFDNPQRCIGVGGYNLQSEATSTNSGGARLIMVAATEDFILPYKWSKELYDQYTGTDGKGSGAMITVTGGNHVPFYYWDYCGCTNVCVQHTTPCPHYGMFEQGAPMTNTPTTYNDLAASMTPCPSKRHGMVNIIDLTSTARVYFHRVLEELKTIGVVGCPSRRLETDLFV